MSDLFLLGLPLLPILLFGFIVYSKAYCRAGAGNVDDLAISMAFWLCFLVDLKFIITEICFSHLPLLSL